MKSVRGEGAISQDVFGDVFEPAVESFLHSGRYRRLLDIKSKIEVIKGTFEWRCIDDKDYVSLLHEDTSQPPFHFSPLPTTAHLCKSFNLFRFIMYLCYFKIQAFWFFLFPPIFLPTTIQRVHLIHLC
jgi:hypothetical protein